MNSEHQRLEAFGPLVLAGLRRTHTVPPGGEEMYWGFAAQWRELAEVAHNIPALPPSLGYGIGFDVEIGILSFDYFSGFVVPGSARISDGFDRVELPEVACAIFRHTGHVSLFRFTLEAIFTRGLPVAGLEPIERSPSSPSFIQRYGQTFNPETGLGGFDVLIPVKA